MRLASPGRRRLAQPEARDLAVDHDLAGRLGMGGPEAVSGLGIVQPDVTLLLDLDGVIRQATLSETLGHEGVEAWLGRPWIETIADVGSQRVSQLVDDARTAGVSGFRQVVQCFPSGLELPMEYTAVRLGGTAGLLAIGKNLQAVAELQSRLVAAQQAMERDYWKLREVETRYRLLFDASNDAVLLLRAADLQILEANPAAIRALGLAPAGREFLAELPPQERTSFRAMLLQVREQGKAPALLVHLGRERRPWLVRASLLTGEPGAAFQLQLAPVERARSLPGRIDPTAVDELIERVPDGFVVLDRDGVILRANRAFLDLVQLEAVDAVLGERLQRWLGRPGADLAVLMANLERHGLVRLLATTLHGALGAETEVEISAAINADSEPRHAGVLLRDVSQRLTKPAGHGRLGPVAGSLTGQIGTTTLQTLVRDTVGAVERHYIQAALELTGDNRTAAAALLGLSRQSLYAKLNRYGLDGGSAATLDGSD